jgi:hypothetical protein
VVGGVVILVVTSVLVVGGVVILVVTLGLAAIFAEISDLLIREAFPTIGGPHVRAVVAALAAM